MESIRSRQGGDPDYVGGLATCDCSSYCYFSLAFIMFTVGTVVTVLAVGTLFNNSSHMWIVGPFFISAGLMVAVRTVLYLRKKNFMALVYRQRAWLRELQGLQLQQTLNQQQQHQQQQQQEQQQRMLRNTNVTTLPPAYDAVVNSNQTEVVAFGETATLNDDVCEESPPPSYNEAMLLALGLNPANVFIWSHE